jgi:hypothetical protein
MNDIQDQNKQIWNIYARVSFPLLFSCWTLTFFKLSDYPVFLHSVNLWSIEVILKIYSVPQRKHSFSQLQRYIG